MKPKTIEMRKCIVYAIINKQTYHRRRLNRYTLFTFSWRSVFRIRKPHKKSTTFSPTVFLPAMSSIDAMNFEKTKNTSAKYCHMNGVVVVCRSLNLNLCWHYQCLANDLVPNSMAYVPDHFLSEPHFAVETFDALFSFSLNCFLWIGIQLFVLSFKTINYSCGRSPFAYIIWTTTRSRTPRTHSSH